MITGKLAYAIILLFLALMCSLVLLARRTWSVGQRYRLRMSAISLWVAAASSFVFVLLLLSWQSPDISQKLGIGWIRVAVNLIVWPTIVAFVLGLAGSGKWRWLAVVSCVWIAVCYVPLLMEAAISGGVSTARHAIKYLVPQGYVGTVTVNFKRDAPPLSKNGSRLAAKISSRGTLDTSTLPEAGWAHDEYFYYANDGRLTPLAETGWCEGGEIWQPETEFAGGINGSKPYPLSQTFFVGPEASYREAHPETNPCPEAKH